MEFNGKPGDERGLVHKRIIAGIGGFIGGGPAGAIAGFARGGGSGGGCPPGLIPHFRTGECVDPVLSAQGISTPSSFIPNIVEELGKLFLPGPTGCPPGFATGPDGFCFALGPGSNGFGPCADPDLVRDRDGRCRFPGSPSGGIGEARIGLYGPAVEPSFQTINTRVCGDDQILGKDKLCYAKGAISNKQRLWPKGRAPLLTGGQVGAIAKANAAKSKVARAYKLLGLAKPARRAPARHQHAVPAQAVSIP